MLKDTEGFLSQRLSIDAHQKKNPEKEFHEYFRRFALRHGKLLNTGHQDQISI
ncbi:MAG: hypothetical protein VX768_14060 [Planctomycetota bacterium]|nr:hypothetical protein [Planctomycetota bacterium]